MKIEYYEEMLEQEAINKYLNMIANDYNGELAKIFQEKYIKKDKEIERLNNIINNAIETIKDEGLVVAIKITNGEEETLLSSKELLLDILKGE